MLLNVQTEIAKALKNPKVEKSLKLSKLPDSERLGKF